MALISDSRREGLPLDDKVFGKTMPSVTITARGVYDSHVLQKGDASVAASSSTTITVQEQLQSEPVCGRPESCHGPQARKPSSLSSPQKSGKPRHPGPIRPPLSTAPLAGVNEKLREFGRLALTRMRVSMNDRKRAYKPLSEKAKFSHNYVEPLCFWWGENARVLLGQSLPSVKVEAAKGPSPTIINCTSHNYAGLYKACGKSETLQRLCLETLSVADARAMPLLEAAAHDKLSKFMGAEFCATTSTGYGANYLALPAIINSDTLVIMDGKCHNSMFTGVFLAQPQSIRKYAYGNMAELEKVLEETTGTHVQTVVIIEGIYSMEGETPPLEDLHRLKSKYDFVLFCDEAHSFLSIGKNGKGCLEHWNDTHPDAPLPWDLIDIRTATLSKSVGGIGGAVFGQARFEHAVVERQLLLRKNEDYESLGASTMVQMLWVLGQPTMVARHLHRVADMAIFSRRELKRFGLHVYGDEGIPTVSIYTGRPTQAGKLSYVLRRRGLLASPVVTPAVAFWEGRVRVNLSAGLSDEQINRLLDIIISGAGSMGLAKKTGAKRRLYKYEPLRLQGDQEENEAEKTYQGIKTLIYNDAKRLSADGIATSSKKTHSPAIVEAGHRSRNTYGIGAGGARWIAGTFPPHLAVESLVARISGAEDCLTYPDASLGLASTIAALSRPLTGYRKHYLILPETTNTSVSDGLTITSKRDAAEVARYQDVDSILGVIRELPLISKAKVYLTVYLFVADEAALKGLLSIIESLRRHKPARVGLTILIHSPYCLVERLVVSSGDTQILVCGSFHGTFGLPGGYLAGTVSMIQELRFTSRGYMYTTSPQPFVMDMLRTILEERTQRQEI